MHGRRGLLQAWSRPVDVNGFLWNEGSQFACHLCRFFGASGEETQGTRVFFLLVVEKDALHRPLITLKRLEIPFSWVWSPVIFQCLGGTRFVKESWQCMWQVWMIFWVTACERENDEEKTCGFIAAQH